MMFLKKFTYGILSNRILIFHSYVIIFVGSELGYNILLELNNITSPVPVNAVAFGTQNGNEGVWRVSNNQSKKF